MSALDRYHQAVVNALIKDGWTITHQPLTLTVEFRAMRVDVGTERLLAAEKGLRKIAVEVKTFGSPSPVHDLEEAIGQHALYEDILAEQESERILYLAIPQKAFDTIFAERIGQIALQRRLHHVMGYSPATEELGQWIPQP